MIPAWYYQHGDADFRLEVPEEGFGGWKQEPLAFSLDHTAVVCMHAWDAGTKEAYPGWWRVVPYLERADAIAREVFPKLLGAVRGGGMTLYHVAGGGDYYQDFPGYVRALELSGEPPASPEPVKSDPVRDRLAKHKGEFGYPRPHNLPDIKRGREQMGFMPQAMPEGDEGVAENGHQLAALCRADGINHLIYCGFALNWCLLLSPGGMAEMQKYGVMCSAFRDATTAVENKHSARGEWAKELALWRVALAFGFVFEVEPFIDAVGGGDSLEPR